MKKSLLILFLAVLVTVLAGSQATAAPSVSYKSGLLVPGAIGVEIGMPIRENATFFAQAGYAIGGMISAGIGCRWYFGDGAWRPFFSLSGGGGMTYTYEYGIVPVLLFTGTGGIEYLHDSGFRFAAEAGLGLMYYVPWPVVGFSVGYQF